MSTNIALPTSIKIDDTKINFLPLTVKIKLGLDVQKTKTVYYGGTPTVVNSLSSEEQKSSVTFDAPSDSDSIDTLLLFAATGTHKIDIECSDGTKYVFNNASIMEDPELGFGIDGTIPFKIESAKAIRTK